MTQETEETIAILDRVSNRTSHGYLEKYQWHFSSIIVVRKQDQFALKIDGHYPAFHACSGFDMLEHLAENYSDIAAKLAEPN